MVKEIRVYFEGDRALREGFRRFFGELVTQVKGRCKIRFIAGGGTEVVQDFRDALTNHSAEWSVLLKDSEGPDSGKLFDQLRPILPKGYKDKDSVFWMVQIMESWFLADADTLADYYGNEFRRGALPRNPKIEEIPKLEVERNLKAATMNTKKGAYDKRSKSSHAPKLLVRIRPERVRGACPNCDRMFRIVKRRLSAR